MESTGRMKSNVNRSWLMWWVLANVVALPILLIPEGVGGFLLGMFSAMTDGMPIGVIGYVIVLIILSFSGFFIGAWLGFWQWLVLRKQTPRVGKWVLRSSIGVAIGAPISWLVYLAIFASPIVNRSDGIYFSYWYGYLAFGIFLGLPIGVSQWLTLRQLFNRAELWIATLPICFTLGISFANFYFVTDKFDLLIKRLAAQLPGTSNIQVLGFFAILSGLTALIGVGLITGLLLDWLSRVQQKQNAM